MLSLNSVRPFYVGQNNIYLIAFGSRKNKCMVASVIILLSNRTLMPLKRPVYAGSQIFSLLKLGKSKDVLKYICLSFISFLPLFYFCCIYYFGSLIFCCQFVARTFIFDYFGLYPSFLVISLMHQNSAFPFVDSPSTYS